MELHIFIRPHNKATINTVQKAGCIQFNKYQGPTLTALGTANCWWKQKYIHARADTSHSVVTIDIPPNTFSRLLHFGFTVEIVKDNQPIYISEWSYNTAIVNGFYLRLNLEAIQLRQEQRNASLAAIFTRHPGLYPTQQEVYFN